MTPVARAWLWQHLLRYSLVRKVLYPMAWVDEPLPDVLPDSRALGSDIEGGIERILHSGKSDINCQLLTARCRHSAECGMLTRWTSLVAAQPGGPPDHRTSSMIS